MSIDRPSLQFAMSLVMSGRSEPKVVHQLQVVRVARYVLQHPGETWLFNYQAEPKSRYVHTDTDWGADELTNKSLSCTVERYGSHMLDCSVAKQSLVARRGDIEANLKDFGADRDGTGGGIRQQCSTRNLHENRFGKGVALVDQRVVDTGSVSHERVPVGVDGTRC